MPPVKTNAQIIAVFDLDGTISKQDTYLAFLFYVLQRHPVRLLRSAWLPLAVILHKLGLRDNHWLKQVFLKTIASGLSQTQIERYSHRFLQNLIDKGLHKDALNTIKTHRQAGHRLILATASFDFYCHELGQRLGFDQVICTQSRWTEKKTLQGNIVGQNCYGNHKRQYVAEQLDKQQSRHIIVYSDHHSDVPLLSWADRAIAVNPTRQLQKIATQQGFDIVYWK